MKDSERKRLNFGECCEVSVPDFALELERGEFALAADMDKPSLLKLFQVVRHGGSGDGLALAERATGDFLTVRNLFEDVEAARVRDRARDVLDPNLREACHWLKKIYINYSMRA